VLVTHTYYTVPSYPQRLYTNISELGLQRPLCILVPVLTGLPIRMRVLNKLNPVEWLVTFYVAELLPRRWQFVLLLSLLVHVSCVRSCLHSRAGGSSRSSRATLCVCRSYTCLLHSWRRSLNVLTSRHQLAGRFVLIVLCHLTCSSGFRLKVYVGWTRNLENEGGVCMILNNKQVKFNVICILCYRLNM
jgi:hypothetical protein